MDYWKLITLLLKSTGVTVSLFVIIIVASLPLGMLLTLTSRCKFKPVSWLSRAYIFVVRGTPLMLQLLFLYFGVPFIPIIGEYIAINDRFAAAAVAFSLNYAAYFAEISGAACWRLIRDNMRRHRYWDSINFRR